MWVCAEEWEVVPCTVPGWHNTTTTTTAAAAAASCKATNNETACARSTDRPTKLLQSLLEMSRPHIAVDTVTRSWFYLEADFFESTFSGKTNYALTLEQEFRWQGHACPLGSTTSHHKSLGG